MSGCSNTVLDHSTVRRIWENRKLSAELCAQTCYLQIKLHQGLVLRPSCVPEKMSTKKRLNEHIPIKKLS
jgi:hypothetical protein